MNNGDRESSDDLDLRIAISIHRGLKMPYTDEPSGLKWINNLNPESFGVIISQFLWAVGSLAFTYVASVDMLIKDGPETFNGLPVSHEMHRQIGFLLAGALLTGWTGKVVAGVVAAQQKRKTHPGYENIIRAEAEGKVAGAAAAVVIADKAKDVAAARKSGTYGSISTTEEHPATNGGNGQ